MNSTTDTENNMLHSTTNTDMLNNLIILDWDDTLFPTKIMKNPQFRNAETIPASTCLELEALSKLVYDVLVAYVDKYTASNIIIVTASQQGWIQQCLSTVATIGHFSSIYTLLFIDHNITMIHPPEALFPFTSSKEVLSWKSDVFSVLIKEHYSKDNTINSFISIGDSIYEFEAAQSAAQQAAKYFDNLYLHRIKLIERPSFKDMMRQMILLLQFCGVFEVSSLKDKANITIDYESEVKKLCAR